MSRHAGVVAAGLALAFASARASPITIGQGSSLGTDRAGVLWYEEFQDWTHGDLRALDDAGSADIYVYGDGLDNSRDLVAFYYREEGSNLYFRVDLHDLAFGAEVSGLDVYVAIDTAPGGQVWMPDFVDVMTDRPWEVCLVVDEVGTVYGSDYRMFSDSFQDLTSGYLGSYFHSQIDAIEFGISHQLLLDQGWDGVSTPLFQVFTAKDGTDTSCSGGGNSSDVTDSILDDDRGCSDGVLNGGIAATSSAGKVFYASIAHGNQSVNKASDVGAHIYDSASSTGIAGGTGFQRTLDTHEIFRVPINIHPSGTLLVALQWAHVPGGASDPQDGPAFLDRIREFVDSDQSETPGSLIGGVLAEHILPYFEGPVNAASIAATDSLLQILFGQSASSLRIMHVPERVMRSRSSGLTPLTGHTFESITASPYVATYLDEVTHLHSWFYPGETCEPDQSYRHKVHRINGIYCFMINDREDKAKFGNEGGGMVLDTRESLLRKALYGNSDEIVLVFDDWEALAGKSFDPLQGVSIPNNNPNQYHNTIRWAANHPWIEISNLRDLLATALADPASFVVDHGYRFDLDLETYEWLGHASEDSYHNWYYNESAGQTGNEQDFYELMPVITGPQGDYFTRGATPADDGPPLPSGRRHGDLNTPGTLLYESWKALEDAPPGRLKGLGIWGYAAMIYETAWHEEDEVVYSDSNCYGTWLYPDASWDGLNTWALRLQNHVRQAGFYAAGAEWEGSVSSLAQGPATSVEAIDLDFDGEHEYVIRNDRVFLVFERYGGRCVLAAAYDSALEDAVVIVGAPLTNPSAPGEEEYTGQAANRCSAFKEVNLGIYADAPYAVTPQASGWRFESPDSKVVKVITVEDGSEVVTAQYQETVAGELFVRLGLSPNPLDLALHGHEHLQSSFDGAANVYSLVNSEGGIAEVRLGGTTFVPNPSDAGFDRRNVALTEQVEIAGNGTFTFQVRLSGGTMSATAASFRPRRVSAFRGPFPSPSAGNSNASFELARPSRVVYEILDLQGRIVATRDLGWRPAGPVELTLEARDARGWRLASGVYFVRVRAGGETFRGKWTLRR